MKFFAISLGLLLVLLTATIVIGCYKGFQAIVIAGIVLVSISILVMVGLFIYYNIILKKTNNNKNSSSNKSSNFDNSKK